MDKTKIGKFLDVLQKLSSAQISIANLNEKKISTHQLWREHPAIWSIRLGSLPNRRRLEREPLAGSLRRGKVGKRDFHLAKLDVIPAPKMKNKNLLISDFCCYFISFLTSPTAVPSLRTQMISGGGIPFARHSTTDPVEFEKSIRLSGSLIKTGPFISFSLFDGAAMTSDGMSTKIHRGLNMVVSVLWFLTIDGLSVWWEAPKMAERTLFFGRSPLMFLV